MNTISCGLWNSSIIKKDEKNGDTIVEWGGNLNIISIIFSIIRWSTKSTKTYTNIKTIACGLYHSVGLKDDGTIMCSYDKHESNTHNQCDPIYISYTNIKAISCGDFHSVGLKEDGTIVCWGNNKYNQLDLLYLTYRNIKAISCGCEHSVGLKEDGTIVCSHFGVGE